MCIVHSLSRTRLHPIASEDAPHTLCKRTGVPVDVQLLRAAPVHACAPPHPQHGDRSDQRRVRCIAPVTFPAWVGACVGATDSVRSHVRLLRHQPLSATISFFVFSVCALESSIYKLCAILALCAGTMAPWSPCTPTATPASYVSLWFFCCTIAHFRAISRIPQWQVEMLVGHICVYCVRVHTHGRLTLS